MKIYGEICPCKGCKERNAECHGKCEKYQQWLNDGVTVTNDKWFSGAKEKLYYRRIHDKVKWSKRR